MFNANFLFPNKGFLSNMRKQVLRKKYVSGPHFKYKFDVEVELNHLRMQPILFFFQLVSRDD